jgi:hypothetical protein
LHDGDFEAAKHHVTVLSAAAEFVHLGYVAIDAAVTHCEGDLISIVNEFLVTPKFTDETTYDEYEDIDDDYEDIDDKDNDEDFVNSFDY